MPKTQWTAPEWLEPYRGLISDTGGNTLETIMTDFAGAIVQVNAPQALIHTAVASQIALLNRLRRRDLLKEQP